MRRRRDRSAMARPKFAIALIAALTALGVLAAPARAADLSISEFETSSSSYEAGGHPDLTTKFTLANAGAPEIPKNIAFDLPPGMFGNPSVLAECSSVDFALTQCSPSSQVGVIVVRPNYKGDADSLLGTAPIFNVDPSGDEAARFAFIA